MSKAESTVTVCQCGEALYQTDDGLMCKRGHPEGWQDTEKPPTGQVDNSSVLSAVSPGKGAEVTMPPGLVMSQDHRYWFNGEGPWPSVTTILEILSKPALVTWKAQESVRAFIRHLNQFSTVLWEQGEAAVVKLALQTADEQRDKAAKLGSSIHLLADLVQRAPEGAETAVEGFRVSDEEKPYLEAWRRFTAFLEAQGASIVSSEHAVWGEGYAGTYDLIVQMDGALWMVDIKTSKGIYPEYALQLAAYGHAAGIILPNDPKLYPMPKIDRYAVLHLRPDAYPQDGYKLIEYPVTEREYFSFISALDLYEWRKEDRFNSKNLIANST
jgi:hypothetical protein